LINDKMNDYIKDYGPEQVELPINQLALMNKNFRASIWTGNHMQVTIMSINPRDDIGVEIHEDIDQILFVARGRASVYSGNTEDTLTFKNNVNTGDMITIPAKTWHNIVNVGFSPLKLISVYAPVKHPYGTLQKTKQDAEHEE